MMMRTVLRVSFALLAMIFVVSRARAQSADQLIAQLQELQGQMAQASDPCPYMARFKQLLNQLANTSPEVYNAMKPSLDAMNQGNDGCSSGAGSSNSSGGSSYTPPSLPRSSAPAYNPQAAEEQRNAYVDAESRYEQQKAATVNSAATCPASGWYAPPGTQALKCRPGQMMPAPQHVDTGVAAPPSCVDSGGTCIPIDQYTAIQAERERLKKQATLCTKSGMLTGQGTQNGDVATMTPIPCTPGDYYIVNGNTATNVNDVPIRLTIRPAPTTKAANKSSAGVSGKSGAPDSTASNSGDKKNGPAAGCYVVMHPGEPPAPVNCCRDMTMMVEVDAHWTDAKKTEVVAFMTNNSMSDLTCSTAFLEKGGVWGEFGTGSLKFGAKHQGGQYGGLWSLSAEAPVLGYKCFEGKDPMTADGQFCNSHVSFPPYAPGTSAR